MKTEISEQVARMIIFDFMAEYCRVAQLIVTTPFAVDVEDCVEFEITKCIQGKKFNSAPSDLTISYNKKKWWLTDKAG